MMVLTLVMRMGRSRVRPASLMAAIFSRPRSRAWLIASINTMALFTTMPASMMRPMSATELMVVPVMYSPHTGPMSPIGIVNRMTNGCSSDSNCEAITR